ncbi:MAG TPA: murein biosynthesis integral membrane protein MurJ [Candidatus Eisenbacteria bacterium]|nr:murein biosynthesis integral membrane protein MurJ [Candidatus Eisenbacteria bacterium]
MSETPRSPEDDALPPAPPAPPAPLPDPDPGTVAMPGGAAAAREAGAGMARAAGLISAATFLSRILGLIREQVFAAQFGAGFAVDAFQVAFRVPNLLRDLFAEGAMSAAFVPTLTRTEKEKGREAAMRLANLVINFLLVVVSAICLVGILAAPWIVRFLAPGFASVPGKLELTTLMTQIMTPFLLLVSLAAAVMGILNTRRIFFLPAVAPTMLNLALIAAGYLIAPFMPRFGLEPIVGMAIGAVLGGLGQLLIQVPALRREGYRWRPKVSFRDPGVLRMAALMAPASIGIAAAQVNVFTSTFLASMLAEGSVSWLNYAYRLMQLPIGLFGVAIATVTLAEVSRHAAAGNLADLKGTLSLSLRLVMLLTLPATLLLMALARPIIALLYEHGRFGSFDTLQTSHALWAYALGLAAFSGVRVMVPAFYSLGMARIPVTVSMCTIAATVLLYFPLMHLLEHMGLALAVSIGSVLNFIALFWMLRRKIGGLGGRRLAWAGARMLLAASVAAAAAAGVARVVESVVGLRSTPERALVVGLALAVAGVVYVGMCTFLRIEELKPLLGWTSRLFGGGRPRS